MSNIFDETQEEFDAKMWKSLEQVKQGKTRPIEEFWEEFEKNSMMQFKVEIAEQAEEDINEKGFYIANDLASPDTAKKTVAEIRKKIASLSYGPFYPV